MCAVELSQSTEAVPDLSGTVGRHQCPGCHGKFDDWTTALHPPNARWYVPESTKTVCPLCGVELEWQRESMPAQVTPAIQGIAFGSAWALSQGIPRELLQRFGVGFSLLTLAVLMALLHLTLRYPFLSSVGQGSGHFIMGNGSHATRKRGWALVLSIVALMTVYWATPQAHRTTVWAAGVSLAIVGCLLAVVWRIRTEKRLRRSAS